MSTIDKSKIKKEAMISEIQEELIIYFREGKINPRSAFDLEDIKFHSIYDILKIHFLLSEEVRNYILKLEKNIRSIKNSTTLEKRLFRGEVRGSIDWNKTIQHRDNHQHNDRMSFVCDNVNKFFETKENIILKRAISIIYTVVYEDIDLKHIKKQNWFRNGEQLAKIISNVYHSNVYIKKMETSKIKISDKMIADVSKSRNEIYRDSAKIVRLYREIMSLEKKHMEDLFEETFIEMKDINEVFELYSIFKYIRNKYNDETVSYNIIDSSEKYLASIEDNDFLYEIYHDKTAVDHLKFRIDRSEVDESNNDYLTKKLDSLHRKDQIMYEVNEAKPSTRFWRGRPDLIIIKWNKNDKTIEEIEIGEIKYTNNMDYLSTGLEELLEYMYLVKEANDYIDPAKIKGLLFVDDIKIEKSKFRDLDIINRERLNSINSFN